MSALQHIKLESAISGSRAEEKGSLGIPDTCWGVGVVLKMFICLGLCVGAALHIGSYRAYERLLCLGVCVGVVLKIPVQIEEAPIPEGGMIRLEALIELRFMNSSCSSLLTYRN